MKNNHNHKILVLLKITFYVTPILLLVAMSIALKLKEHSELWYLPLVCLVPLGLVALMELDFWIARKESKAEDEEHLKNGEN